MGNYELESYLTEVFQSFTKGDNVDINIVIEELIRHNKLSSTIKYNKYDGAINSHIAKYVLDYQHSIYKIAANVLYSGSIQKLTDKDKQLLEVSFSIQKGCTEAALKDPNKFLQKVKELLNMLPEKQRFPALISILAVMCFVSSLIAYYNLEKLELEDQKDIKLKEYDRDISYKMSDSLDNAVKQLAYVSKANYKAVVEYEKQTLNNLASVDDEVIIDNKEILTSKRFKEIRKERYPKEDSKKIVPVSGFYRITNIGLINQTITVMETFTGNKMTVCYNSKEDDWFNNVNLEEIKKEISESVLKESKAYKMSITKVIKNGKLDTAILNSIEEVEDIKDKKAE